MKHKRLRKAEFFSNLNVGDQFYFDWSEGPHANSLMIKVSPYQCKDLDETSPYFEYLFSVDPSQVVRTASTKKKADTTSVDNLISSIQNTKAFQYALSVNDYALSKDSFSVTLTMSPGFPGDYISIYPPAYGDEPIYDLVDFKNGSGTTLSDLSLQDVVNYLNFYNIQASSKNKKQVKQAGYTLEDFKHFWVKDVINNPYNFDINNDNMFFDALMQMDKPVATVISWVKSVYDDAGVTMSTDEIKSLFEQWVQKRGFNIEDYE